MQLGFLQKIAFYTNMWLFSCLLLTFVLQANGEGANATVDYEMFRRTFQYYDKYIYTRYLDTEKQTCELARRVVQILQNMTATDVWDPLWMVSEHLDKIKTIAKGGDGESCVQEISESWNNFILQENNLFKQRLESGWIEQEKQQTFVAEVSRNYSIYMTKLIESIEECRDKYSPQLKKCIAEARNRRGVQKGSLQAVVVTYGTSKKEKFLRPCMTAFETSVIAYHAQRTDSIFEEIYRVRTNLEKCSNKSNNAKLTETITKFELPDPDESSERIVIARRLYDHAHSNIWNKLDAFVRLDIRVQLTSANVSRYLDSIWDNPRRSVRDYVDAIKKSRDVYPELHLSKCNVEPDMNLTIADGVKDVETCRVTYVGGILQCLTVGEQIFDNVTRELSQVGNVAILECISDPYAFTTSRVEECYMLRFSKFNNMWDKVQTEVDDIMAKLSLCLPQKQDQTNPAQLCGDLQHQKMLFRASQLIYDYKKCLFLETKKDYNITLPAVSTSKPPTNPGFPTTDDGLSTSDSYFSRIGF